MYLVVALTACRGRAPATRAIVAKVAGNARDARAASADAEAPPVARFVPHWSCRITGPGRVGYGLDGVAVAPPHPGDPDGAVRDALSLRDGGGVIARVASGSDGGDVPLRARVRLARGADSGASEREYDVAPGAVEMLFEDERGSGGAVWDGQRLRLYRVGASGDEVVDGAGGDPTRPCASAPANALRLVPIASNPWEFPSVHGMPPSVATARWTLALDAAGLCVVRLEGDGPWGKVQLRPAGREMRGELWLDESINPVVCGPAGM